MKPTPGDELSRLEAAVLESGKYRRIAPELVRRVAAQELAKGRPFKEAVKAVRSKLHQVGAAYQEAGFDFVRASAELAQLPPGDSPELRAFSQRWMQQHASTRERLPILAHFYSEILASLGPIHSLMDLACGLNPLALPWLPLAPGARVLACDIYLDLVDFLNGFFTRLGVDGRVEICDLTQTSPTQPVQLAMLLKTLPCLEQVDKTASARLLADLPAEHILISYPVRSLSGHAKGMLDTYEAHFARLTAGQPWQIRRFEFSSELAFLISR